MIHHQAQNWGLQGWAREVEDELWYWRCLWRLRKVENTHNFRVVTKYKVITIGPFMEMRSELNQISNPLLRVIHHPCTPHEGIWFSHHAYCNYHCTIWSLFHQYAKTHDKARQRGNGFRSVWVRLDSKMEMQISWSCIVKVVPHEHAKVLAGKC